jgi:S1-C subfamily serine protease
MISKRPGKGFRIAIYDSGLIANVGPDGLAREAGLKVGDTLLAVDGVEIKSAKQLYDILGKVVDSSLVTFKVKRSPDHEGKKMKFTLY